MNPPNAGQSWQPTRTPIKRAAAESYILLSLTCFGLTIFITRVYLEWANYPQIGNDVLHIAHALWGGLLLFIAALLTLILVNRWVFRLSAILSGVGVGLFIDEVGKFITQKNDYFFPPAAPIIYSSFLLMVLLFLLVRRARHPSPRASMYRVVLALQEVLDSSLDPRERSALLAELKNGKTAPEPHIAQLAEQITLYLSHASIPLQQYRPGFGTLVAEWLRRVGTRIGRKTHKRLIIGLMSLASLSALLITTLLVWGLLSPDAAAVLSSSVILAAERLAVQNMTWHVVRIIAQAVVGLLYLLALVRLWRSQEEAALNTAIFAALLSFTVVNLLDFYLNQFRALSDFTFSLAVFAILLAYRAWYLVPNSEDE